MVTKAAGIKISSVFLTISLKMRNSSSVVKINQEKTCSERGRI